MSNERKLAWIALLGGVAMSGCTEPIHDPWVEPPGTMQTERNVGADQQDQLRDRLQDGQAER